MLKSVPNRKNKIDTALLEIKLAFCLAYLA